MIRRFSIKLGSERVLFFPPHHWTIVSGWTDYFESLASPSPDLYDLENCLHIRQEFLKMPILIAPDMVLDPLQSIRKKKCRSDLCRTLHLWPSRSTGGKFSSAVHLYNQASLRHSNIFYVFVIPIPTFGDPSNHRGISIAPTITLKRSCCLILCIISNSNLRFMICRVSLGRG